jgi:hypothetical protein
MWCAGSIPLLAGRRQIVKTVARFRICRLCAIISFMAVESKVLTGLMERRALEAEFGRLTALTDPAEQEQQAAAIAAHGPLALTVFLSLLDTDDPLMRGRLGLVAQQLPREQVVAALRNIVSGGGRRAGTSPGADVDRPRISAAILLDRYLHEAVDDHAMGGMGDPDRVARQSLQELVRAMQLAPTSILEYLAQLAQQPPDVPHLLLKAIPALGHDWPMVTLLRMFAQESDQVLARGALEQLSRIRSAAASRALTSLAATLPPPLAVLAERGRRKVQMSVGVSHADPGAADEAAHGEPWYAPGRDWRVLLSPVESTGGQLIWFSGQAGDNGTAVSCVVVTHGTEGIQLASAGPGADALELPPPAEPGTLHRVKSGPGGYPLLLLEAPLHVGRQLVREALALNWAQGRLPPVEYRLFNPLIWLVEAAPDAADEIGAASAPSADAPAKEISAAERAGAIASLLDHEAFLTWLWPLPEPPPANVTDPAVRAEFITHIAATQFGPETKAEYARALQKMARWFTLAGDTPAATAALAAADEMQALPAEESIFLRRLVGIGLDFALAQQLVAGKRMRVKRARQTRPMPVPKKDNS